MGKFSRSFQPRQSRSVREYERTPAFSYRANRVPQEEAAGQRKNARAANKSLRRFRWQQVPTYIMGFVIAVGVIYILTLSSDPKVVIRATAGDKSNVFLREQSVYSKAAQEVLEGSLSNKTKITINTTDFDKKMRERFPELSTATITLPLMGRRPIVELAVVDPAIIVTNSQNKDYVLDKEGRAIIPAAEAKGLGSLQLPRVADQSGSSIKPGEGILTAQSVTFITTFTAQLRAKDLTVNTITLPPLASEVQFKIDNESYFIKASLMTDPRLAAGSFLAMKQKLEADGTKPAEYVDVRVEEKVFYK